jgi:hypothetical protein
MRMKTRPEPAARCGRWLLVLPLCLALALLGAPPVAAAGPRLGSGPISGSFRQTSFVPSNTRTVDGVTSFDFTEQDTLTGSFTGTSLLQGSCVVRASGQGVCRARETFTGTVDGRSGTAEFQDVSFLDQTTGAIRGSFTIVGGTGDLANLHGRGTFQGVGTTGTYAGQVVVAP